MKKANIGIVGYGIVGSALAHGFKGENIFTYDKYKKGRDTLPEVVKKSEFIFICVPTPILKDGSSIDLSIVEEAVKNVVPYTNGTNKIVVIKSTSIPGTTARLMRRYPKTKFAFNPEFLREKTFLSDFVKADRIIIGAKDKKVLNRVAALHKKRFPQMPIFKTDPTSAELAKYMANCFLAAKVIFGNEMYALAQKLGVSYPEVKQMVVADHRIFDSHLDISKERGFGGKCFPKDTLALLALMKKLKVDSTLLSSAWKKNLKIRKVRDWDEIPFAVSSKKRAIAKRR